MMAGPGGGARTGAGARAGVRFGPGFRMGAGRPMVRSKDFWGTLRRLLAGWAPKGLAW